MQLDAIATRFGTSGLRTPGASWCVPVRQQAPFGVSERLRGTPFRSNVPFAGQPYAALVGEPSVVLARLAKAAAAGRTVAAFGRTTVRTQHNYMTRVITDGGDTAGPPRWRVPV